MQLSPCQKSHVDTVFPECRQRIAEYLVRGAEVVVFRQTECGSDVPPFAVAPVDDIEFWIGCWDSYELAVESALALGLQVQLAPQWFKMACRHETTNHVNLVQLVRFSAGISLEDYG